MSLVRLWAATMGVATLTFYAEAAPPGGRPQPAAPLEVQEPPARIEDLVVRLATASRPGPEHQWLEPLAGSWTMDVVFASPSQQPLHITGTCQTRWILGGRFLSSELKGGEDAARVEGMGVYGYDAQAKQFFTVFLNNLGTGYAESWGGYDPVTHSFIFNGKRRDPTTGRLTVYRSLLRIENSDHHVLQVFTDVPGRPPLKLVEASFTRQ